jgi:hypothetical protein
MRVVFATLVALFVLFAVLGSWVLMILIGNLHASIAPNLIPIGFWDSMSIALPLSSVVAFLTATRSNE